MVKIFNNENQINKPLSETVVEFPLVIRNQFHGVSVYIWVKGDFAYIGIMLFFLISEKQVLILDRNLVINTLMISINKLKCSFQNYCFSLISNETLYHVS